jgi:hypothetical protein
MWLNNEEGKRREKVNRKIGIYVNFPLQEKEEIYAVLFVVGRVVFTVLYHQ